jgi:DNA sulfur modification protein DndE
MQVPKGLETIRLSQQMKEQLIRLKRQTGIQQWNILCRWALLTSLADPTEPPDHKIPADSSVEMDWKTFAGEYGEVFLALLALRYPAILWEPRLKQHLSRSLGGFVGGNRRKLAFA